MVEYFIIKQTQKTCQPLQVAGIGSVTADGLLVSE